MKKHVLFFCSILSVSLWCMHEKLTSKNNDFDRLFSDTITIEKIGTISKTSPQGITFSRLREYHMFQAHKRDTQNNIYGLLIYQLNYMLARITVEGKVELLYTLIQDNEVDMQASDYYPKINNLAVIPQECRGLAQRHSRNYLRLLVNDHDNKKFAPASGYLSWLVPQKVSFYELDKSDKITQKVYMPDKNATYLPKEVADVLTTQNN